MSPERVENLRRLGASWVDDGTHPTLGLLVARRGVVVLHEAFGKQGPEVNAAPLSTDSIFPIASMSKLFVATCAMLLVEDGLLGLNRPVQEYVPEFSGPGKEDVLVHHLLSHTSGLSEDEAWSQFLTRVPSLADRPALAAERTDSTQHSLIAEILESVYESPLVRRPGEMMVYSQFAAYLLLTEAIRRISGRSVVDFSRTRLFEPLGMKDTSFMISEMDRPRMVRRPQGDPIGDNLELLLGRLPVGPGSATSTVLDMATFCQAFLATDGEPAPRTLSGATVREMTRNQIPGTATEIEGKRIPEASWGYGWAIKGYEKWRGTPSLLSEHSIWHSGFGGTALWADPVHELVCVYFSVTPRTQGRQDAVTNQDLFVNAAVAAIAD
jgi:CubicO group peptidase (beta-lactamase class C family)